MNFAVQQLQLVLMKRVRRHAGMDVVKPVKMKGSHLNVPLIVILNVRLIRELWTCSGIDCGIVLNNCNQNISCGGCAANEQCVSGACVCVDETREATCQGLCGPQVNNCGNSVTCDPCPCVPEDLSVTCTGLACGSATNNCGDVVTCPDSCALPQTCNTVTNTCECIEEDVSVTCAGVACGSVVNNCGNTVTCPDTCVLPETCNVATNICGCVEEDVSVSCAGLACGSVINNCGNTVTCPDTCVLPEACDTATNTCECVAPSPCGVGLCGLQIDACGVEIDCGTDCGCFEAISAWQSGVCTSTADTTCPADIAGTTCSVPGETCVVCREIGNVWVTQTFRCDPICDPSCIPHIALAPYPCQTPNPAFFDYSFECGTA